MARSRKGMTLVEVLVSMVLFSLSFLAVTATVIYSRRETQRQKVQSEFMAICYDIDLYSTKYQRDWDINYFNDTTRNTIIHQETSTEEGSAFFVYYDNSFQTTTDASSFSYLLRYSYATTNEMTVSISYASGSKVFSDINYGANRYA